MNAEVTKQFQAIILAGGINNIELYEGYKPNYKALLEFNSKPSITYTLQALANCKQIKSCVGIVGPEKEIKNYKTLVSKNTTKTSLF